MGEVVALKVGDIDSKRMTQRVEQGKGLKDRYAKLSPVLLEAIEHGTAPLHLGCELAQGYGNARPMPGADMPAWVAAWQPDDAWSGLK